MIGLEASPLPTGYHDPMKQPKRISSDKLRHLQEAKDRRSYNIITNACSK